jgi:putative transposase
VAVLLDACSRRVVGWALADHVRTELALEALAMALQARRPAAGLVHHTAHAYQALLVSHGIAASLSRVGDCYDNAMAERCFATLKAERIDTRPWPTRRAPRQALFAWLEVCYNRQRSHSALGFLTAYPESERAWRSLR